MVGRALERDFWIGRDGTLWRKFPEVMPPRDVVVLFQQRLGLQRFGYVDGGGVVRFQDEPWKDALPELISWWTEGPEAAPLRTEWKEVAL